MPPQSQSAAGFGRALPGAHRAFEGGRVISHDRQLRDELDPFPTSDGRRGEGTKPVARVDDQTGRRTVFLVPAESGQLDGPAERFFKTVRQEALVQRLARERYRPYRATHR